MNKKKIILIIATVVVAGALVWWFWGPTPQNKVTFESAKVAKGSISNSVTATGTVEPVIKVEVGTQVSGIINKIFVDYNSVVKKGQVIAELDKIVLLNTLASAKNNLASAKTEYEYQLKTFTRIKTLHQKTLVSDSDYDTALYNYEKAKSSYSVSKNDVAKAETNLGYATIYSPIDGIVLSRSVEEGQTVASSYSTPTLFIIAKNLTDMQVVANVDEADIGGITEGLRTTFTVDAYPNKTFEGKVTQVRLEATTTDNVVTYEVVVSAPNPDLELKPGLTANITFYTLEKNDILVVPSKALRFTPDKALIGPKDKVVDCDSKEKIWTRTGNTFTAHPVKVGITNGILTEIISGITEGTSIVTDAVAGKMPGETAGQASKPDSSEQKESSPFMPTRPGANKKK